MYWEYFKYILKHKWYVGIELVKRGLYWRALTHDLSKLYPDEFILYAKNYLGKNRFTFNDQTSLAELKHHHRNPHHWQHWIHINNTSNKQTFPMPRKDIIEMLCDIKSHPYINLVEFFADNRISITLHSSTSAFINRELGIKRKPYLRKPTEIIIPEVSIEQLHETVYNDEPIIQQAGRAERNVDAWVSEAQETYQGIGEMTEEEQEEQRRSFAYGNLALHNENITKELIDNTADKGE